ncbi:MAG: hypothetical protein MK003_12240, partial [Pseudomonadales bacterium]|nr:hypothetical protein [Pseudomonadales bacterium]
MAQLSYCWTALVENTTPQCIQQVINGVNQIQCSFKSVIIVTHYQRILEYITPDYVHVLVDGKIAKSGDKNLAL